MATAHTHAPNFGRKVANCPRCVELANGAPPVQWRNSRQRDEALRTLEIRAHDCTVNRCGPVCTAFDW